MDARNPDYVTASGDDEISLGDIARAVWRSRTWAVLGGVAAVALAGTAILAQFLGTPNIPSFRQDIALTLEGSSYPNGTEFSTNDLRSPIVLQRVYDDAGLDAFGLSLREFSAAVSITPASATYDGVIARYRSRLADTGLTYTERQQIESEFGTALAGALAAGARVELVMPPGHDLPAELGRSVVTAIPNTWADIYINQLGVLALPLPGSSAQLIDTEFLTALDYPMAHDALRSSLSVLSSRIGSAKTIPGAQNLRAENSGRTLFDIERDIRMLERYSVEHVLAPLTELGLNKSPEVTAAAYRYQIDELSRRTQLAEDNASVIDAALTIGNTSVATAPMANSGIGEPAFGFQAFGNPNSVVQQFGPELVDRLVLMSVENASVDFREALIQSKLEYERQALEFSADRAMFEQRLALISGEVDIPNREILADIFTEESERVASDLNTAWAEVETILAQANVARISHDRELFRFLPTPDQASNSRALIDSRSIVMLVAAALGGLILGMIAHMASGAIRNRSA